MKIILGVFFLALSVALGYLFSTKYTERKKAVDALKNFHVKVKNEVNFTQKSIVELVKNLKGDSALEKYLREFFIDKNENLDELKCLKVDEKEFVSEYAKTVGNGDKKQQLKYLEGVDLKIEEFSKSANEDCKKYKPLCIKLGLLFGLIMLIITL